MEMFPKTVAKIKLVVHEDADQPDGLLIQFLAKIMESLFLLIFFPLKNK